MYRMLFRLALCLTLCLSTATALALAQSRLPPNQFKRMLTNDEGLRRLVTHSPAPIYPTASISKRVSGVVVSEIEVNPNGRPEKVTILEAPDDAIRKSVQEAVKQWTFRSVGVPVLGKLIFYFHLREGRGLVSSPEEMKALKGESTKQPAHSEPPVKEVAESDLKRLATSKRLVFLDIRDRPVFLKDHRRGAINIPLNEALSRINAELPRGSTIVVDCFPEQYATKLCGIATHFLTSSGFTDVLVLRR